MASGMTTVAHEQQLSCGRTRRDGYLSDVSSFHRGCATHPATRGFQPMTVHSARAAIEPSLAAQIVLAQTQVSLALSQLICGDWAAALTSAAEAARLAQETPQSGVVPVAQLIEAILCAARGAHDRVAVLVDSVERVALSLAIGGILSFATLARGWAALASGPRPPPFRLSARGARHRRGSNGVQPQ
jgi:hypothetical protein